MSPTAVTNSLQPLIDAIDQADSPERLIGAVQALATTRQEESIPTLIKVLGYNNPGAAIVAVRGLVQMGDIAVLPLLNLLDEYNYGARAYAIRALSAIADPRALDVLLTAAETDFAPSVRRAATKGLGNLRWSLLAAEEAIAAQQRAHTSLMVVLADSDWSLRYAAIVGLQTLAESAEPLRSTILTELQHRSPQESDRAVQSRMQWAIAALCGESFDENHRARSVSTSMSR